MAPEKLWFRHTIEGLMLGVGTSRTPALEARLEALGVNVNRLRPGYPCGVMAEVVRELGATLFPSLPRPLADREVGRLFLRGYGHTFVGITMLRLMRIIGPRATLERMQRNFRTGTNFIETRFTALSPRCAEVWFNDDAGVPGFYAGIVLEGALHTGARNTQVTERGGEGDELTLRVDWDE